MSKDHRQLSEDEHKLWRRVTAEVRARRSAPLAPADFVAAPTPPPERPAVSDAPVQTRRAINVAAPADRSGEKRVRRGRVEIGSTLDLHGHTQESAQKALLRFLLAAYARNDRAVIVVTGVGRGGGGVLKQRLPDWLAEPSLRQIVSGYAPAHRQHGGAGAFYVFLRRGSARGA